MMAVGGDTFTGQQVHLGCGPGELPGGWIHVDASWNARLSKHPILRQAIKRLRVLPQTLLETTFSRDVLIHDLRTPLPFADSSVSAIYASHVLEHLYFDEAKTLLRECYRTLHPGGIVRFVVPDLRYIVNEYIDVLTFPDTEARRKTMTRAEVMNARLSFHPQRRPGGSFLFRLYTALSDFHLHKWMWDFESLQARLEEAGFDAVAQRALHDSDIPNIQAIEQPSRVLDGEGICVEAIKPRDLLSAT